VAKAAGAEYTSFRPGRVWLDTDGNVIQAHAGSIIYHQGTYYWYGTEYAAGGQYFTCYTSADLYNWKYEGYVLQVDESIPDLSSRMANGRAHVKRNAATGKYALWLHVDEWTGFGKGGSRAGVAVSQTPTGLFQYLGSAIPATHRGKENGFRDDNLFVDDDGRAYVFYASEANSTMYVVRLSADFLDVERPAVEGATWARNLIDRGREAPAPFKHDGRYYLITSGCTGWAHNAADCAVSTAGPLGPYVPQGNPCVGPGSETTFESQSTCVFPVAGKPAGSFIFVADRWNGGNLSDSRYVWLPLKMNADGTFQLQWHDEWDLSVFGPSARG
jgi:beta-xylosidase